MSRSSDRPQDAEEASSMRANDPTEVSSIPAESRQREMGRGEANLYTGSDTDEQEDSADGQPETIRER